MAYPITYVKSEVLQALRYHFIKQREIKSLMIIINLYAIVTAVLLFMKKIRPEPFLLGSILWILLMAFFWFIALVERKEFKQLPLVGKYF
jgi:hypothetical protein